MGGKVVSNLEQLAEGIGSYLGMMEGLKQRDYMDDLLRSAHAKVSVDFNRAAMTAAMGGANFKHMYEYGTVGINDSGLANYASGMNKNARLWENVITGGGGRKTISFTFLPSKKNVPPHDFEELGIDPSTAPPLKVDTGERKYKWPSKAAVIESGADVKVKPRWSKMVFVPIKTEGMPARYFGDPDRGYVWTKEGHTYSPGESSGGTGKFTTFFTTWWSTTGGELMGDEMMDTVNRQLKEVSATIKTSKQLKTPATTNIKSAAEKGRKKTRKQWELKVDFYEEDGTVL